MSDKRRFSDNIDIFINKHLDGGRLWLNIKRELVLFYGDIAIAIGCLAVILTLVLNMSDPRASYSIMNFFAVTLYPVAAMLVASSAFKYARTAPTNVFYLTNPTTTAEKVVTAWFISFIIFPTAVFILLISASFLGSTRHLFDGNISDYTFFMLSTSYRDKYLSTIFNLIIYKELVVYYFVYKFISAALFNAIYLYGSILFGRRAWVKTLISLVIIVVVVMSFIVLVSSLFFGSALQGSFNFNTFIANYSSKTVAFIALLALLPSLLLVVYFWFLSYLKLSETEV